MQKPEIKAPVCLKKEHVHEIHGDKRFDPYFWLNDRENPEVIQYLNEENAYTEAVLKPVENLKEQLFQEIIGRIKQTDESVPYKLNGYWYITRFEEGKEYPIFSRKKDTLENQEEILLDVNKEADGHSFYEIGGLSISIDNRYLAFSCDTVSRRLYTLYVKDLQTGELLDIHIENTSGSVAWAADSKTFLFTQKDPKTLRSNEIRRSDIFSGGDSVLVFNEKDETFSCFVYTCKSKKFLIIGSMSTLTSEFQILEAQNPLGKFRIFNARTRGIEYGIEHYQDKFYISTNFNAQNFRLMECPDSKTGISDWKEVIPHRPETLLEGLEIFKGHLVVFERTSGLNMIRVINQKSGEEHYLDFGEETYTAGPGTNPEFDSEIFRFGYTSLTTPNSTFDYNLITREKTLLKQKEVVGGYESDDYHSERLWADSHDGVKVPISLVYKKGLVKNGKNPVLLYAYGSYGHSLDPYFSSVRLSLLNRGFVFAIAHIRGGEDLGRPWYDNGKLLKKKNTFYDFIACAEFLIRENFTTPRQLYASGGSAGGLLMGAVINMKPDLWAGVVSQVPFVDVVTTMLDDSIPLTTGEYDEWGNPNDKAFYDYIKSYSPYDNIEEKGYPNLLVTTGLHDSQVQYWEPAKWVARLREMKQDQNLLLLHTNMETGHGGASGRFEVYKDTALEYAFLLGLENKSIKNH